MEPEIPLEVWQADIPWNKADYPRPVIFLGHRANDRLIVVRVSSQFDLMADGDFIIRDDDPDFGSTGLSKTSYVRGPMLELPPASFVKRKGFLAGKLRERFEEWLDAQA